MPILMALAQITGHKAYAIQNDDQSKGLVLTKSRLETHETEEAKLFKASTYQTLSAY